MALGEGAVDAADPLLGVGEPGGVDAFVGDDVADAQPPAWPQRFGPATLVCEYLPGIAFAGTMASHMAAGIVVVVVPPPGIVVVVVPPPAHDPVTPLGFLFRYPFTASL